MKHLKIYESFNINEGTTDPADVKLLEDYTKAFTSTFKDAKYVNGWGNMDKVYDYKNGYVEIPRSFTVNSWDYINPKASKILESNGFQPWTLKSVFWYYEVISKSQPKPPTVSISLSGDNYGHVAKKFDMSKPFDKQLAAYKKELIGMTAFDQDLIKVLLTGWKSISKDSKHKNSTGWGYGSQAVTYITKTFEATYAIKDLDKALGMKKEDVESTIKSHFMFKKDELKFDWKNGIMYVNGEFGEYWD